jgi:hypothetical protein
VLQRLFVVARRTEALRRAVVLRTAHSLFDALVNMERRAGL